MLLLLLLLPFSTLLHQSLGQNTSGIVSITPKKSQKEIIDRINAIRREVQPTASNMLKMKWSDRASQSAKDWAAYCQMKPSPKKLRTVDGTFCGEGRLQSNYVLNWPEILDKWHKKMSNFKYGVGAIDPNKDIYSYTQLIWYNTNEIGCAVAYCPDADYPFFYVCRFCPAGNVKEHIEIPYKDGPPCGDCPDDCEDKLCRNSCDLKDKRNDCANLLYLFNCDHPWVKTECQATCECRKSII